MTKAYTNPENSFTIVFSWEAPDPNHDTFNERPHWVDFVVYEITGTCKDGSPAYTSHFTPEYNPDDQWCSGHIKWDGCMEIHDFNAHFCGWSRKMEYLMRDLYLQAATIMDEWMLEEYGNLKDLKQHCANMQVIDNMVFRNDRCRELVERVNASADQPINLDIDISGLYIDQSVKTLILKNYHANQPFGLSDETGEYLVYFFPSYGCAVWCDAGKVTLNTFQDNAQFEKCIKAALVAHRKFVGIMQLTGDRKYKEIVEQLKQIR